MTRSILSRARALRFKWAVLTLSLLPACGDSDTPPCQQPSEKEGLFLNICENPSSLDPRIVRTLRDSTLVEQLFEGLMRLDSNALPQPALAQSYEISEEGLTYTFYLRDALWTNGQAVTAHDFVYAWTSVLDPTFPADYAHLLYPIKNGKLAKEGSCSLDAIGVVALDDKTLVVHLENPTPYFLELLALPTLFPVNAHLVSKNPTWADPPAKHFVSNGPFALEKWVPHETLKLKKNESYHDAAYVTLASLSFSFVTDNVTESYLYEKGELDWLGQPLSNSLTAELTAKLKKEGVLQSYNVAGTFWLKYNAKKTPFDDARIRRAFAFAINRQEIIEGILQGNQERATSILPPTMLLTEKSTFEDGNLEMARSLFNEALSANQISKEELPPLTLSYLSTERNAKIASFVQDQWRTAFDIEVKLEAVERSCYWQKLKKGDFVVATGDWIADYNDPLSFFELFASKRENGGLNDMGWENEEFDQLLMEAKGESDATKRGLLLTQMEKILHIHMPVAPLYHYCFEYLKKEEISGVSLSPLGAADFKGAKKSRAATALLPKE